jgi:hypothetical protein
LFHFKQLLTNQIKQKTMKKNFYRMFAAILFCGAMTTVFTSCSKDDDDNNGGSTPSGQQGGETNQPTKRDVELNFIAQKKSLQYFEYDFKYVDAKGNTKTIDIDENTASASIGTLAQFPLYTQTISGMAAVEAYADLANPFIYRVTLKDQPVGKTISYTTTCHVKENATITETLQYATPGVLAVSVADNIAYSPFSIRTWKINPDRWSAYVETVEGKTIEQATFEFEVK